MRRPLETLRYFFSEGLRYGTLMGLMFGTLVIPVIGTGVGLVLGILSGMISGIGVGLLVMVYNSLFLNPNMEQRSYRRSLMIFVGIVTIPAVFAIVYCGLYIFLSSLDLRTSGGAIRDFVPDLQIYSALFLVPASIFAGITSVYITHEYADRKFWLITKRKNDAVAEIPVRDTDFYSWYLRQSYGQLWWGLVLTGIIAILVFFLIYPSQDTLRRIGEIILLCVFSSLYSLFITPVIVALNIMIIKWLNRLVFREFLPHLSFKTYRWLLSILVGIITFICTPLITYLLGSPAASLIAARVTWLYADKFYATNDTEKAKNNVVNT